MKQVNKRIGATVRSTCPVEISLTRALSHSMLQKETCEIMCLYFFQNRYTCVLQIQFSLQVSTTDRFDFYSNASTVLEDCLNSSTLEIGNCEGEQSNIVRQVRQANYKNTYILSQLYIRRHQAFQKQGTQLMIQWLFGITEIAQVEIFCLALLDHTSFSKS